MPAPPARPRRRPLTPTLSRAEPRPALALGPALPWRRPPPVTMATPGPPPRPREPGACSARQGAASAGGRGRAGPGRGWGAGEPRAARGRGGGCRGPAPPPRAAAGSGVARGRAGTKAKRRRRRGRGRAGSGGVAPPPHPRPRPGQPLPRPPAPALLRGRCPCAPRGRLQDQTWTTRGPISAGCPRRSSSTSGHVLPGASLSPRVLPPRPGPASSENRRRAGDSARTDAASHVQKGPSRCQAGKAGVFKGS